MSPARLLEHFNRLIDTPDAVPRLRRFILDLAVRGKLVEQDSKDEPAGALLKRVEKEKSRLAKVGTIRTPKPHSPMMEEEIPFGIPKSWRWVRLGEVGAIVGGGTPPSKDASCFTEGGDGIAWLTPADLGKHAGLFVAHGARDLTEKGLSCASAQLMPAGSVLFTSRAPIGYTAIAANVITTNQGFKSVVPFLMESNRYIAMYFTAFATWINGKASGTTFKEVSGKIVGNLPFPLPPIAEQHRVVAKVAELMALCDELEATQTKREKRRDRLVAATLHGLNNGGATPIPGAPSTFEESARFYFNHLPRLTTRPEHIHQLRQTILNLAVRGKLVPQDPKDEPAVKLFQRIAKDKLRLIREGEIRRQQPLPLVPSPEAPFTIPAEWVWARLSSLSIEITSGSRGWAEFYASVGPKFIRAQNIRFGSLDLRSVAHVELPTSTEGKRTSIRKADLLVVITGAGVTNPGLLAEDIGEAYVSQHVALIRPAESATPRWLLMCLMATDACRGELLELAYGAGKPGLNLDNLRMLRIPLPPHAEQHRIAAKVGELMSLLEKLETCLTETITGASQLLYSCLNDAMSQQRD